MYFFENWHKFAAFGLVIAAYYWTVTAATAVDQIVAQGSYTTYRQDRGVGDRLLQATWHHHHHARYLWWLCLQGQEHPRYLGQGLQ